ncbi:hypothetical protein AB0C59_21455 [Streptomyces sp. NPDC048664]|uniref:hypothetical protein n=1 Tax=Streptomyces sp. NPDC048664 TaxID=3154505 RepID=UPI00341F34A1
MRGLAGAGGDEEHRTTGQGPGEACGIVGQAAGGLHSPAAPAGKGPTSLDWLAEIFDE